MEGGVWEGTVGVKIPPLIRHEYKNSLHTGRLDHTSGTTRLNEHYCGSG